jgi:tRNA(Ile)-lysidine synthase
VSELLDTVDQTIRKRRLFLPGQRILVAVSGGADSMALLHVLHALAARYGWRLTVAHLNHQLRGRSSDADERLVRRTAQQLKLPVVAERADVRKLARAEKLSIEMAARQLRHEFLARAARRRRIPCTAVAHHAYDQLELFFLRLLRGSGGEGLAGMKWRSPSPKDPSIEVVRPLLDQPKAALVEYAAEHGIRYREDASNALLDFQRNRIRHELLPLLRRKYQPALDRTIARVMEIVGAEADFAAQAAGEWMKSKVRGARGEGRGAGRGSVGASERLSVGQWRAFDQLPMAVQRRCVQAQLVKLGVAPEFDLVEQLRLEADRQVEVRFGTAPGKAQGKVEKPGVRYAVRDQTGRVHLRAGEAVEFNRASKNVPLEGRSGKVEFDGATIGWSKKVGCALCCAPRTLVDDRESLISAGLGGAQRSARPTIPMAGRELFDADKVGSPICLRHWRPGDRFQPIGMRGPVKLQDFFVNQRVPRGHRRQLIVAAAANGELFWVEGMRISERFKLTQHTIRCLQWSWKRL